MPETRSAYDDKRARILRSAAEVFADRGYHRASIRDISRATGVSLSGLYYYVESKEELLFQIQDHCFSAVLENVERLLRGEKEPTRRLRIFVENHLRFFASNMREMKVLSHEADSLTGEYRDRVNRKKRRYTELCAAILRDLAPPERDADVRVATYALFGMMNWIYTWYHSDGDVPVEELAQDVSRLFLYGYMGRTTEALPTGADEPTPGSVQPSIWRR